MNITKKAFEVARDLHEGKVRKAEVDKPFILHPISVASKLYDSGYENDDNIIAAGLLHDVVEGTDCTIEHIYKEFGSDIGSLVNGVSESDPNLPWEERKKETIRRTKKYDLRHKNLKGADGWDNTEDLVIKFGIAGKKDFSSFKRGEAKKIWYWENLHQSLIYNQDSDQKIFKSFKNNIDKISGEVEFEKLDTSEKLYYKTLELHKLKNISDAISKFNEMKKSKTTYVVGVTGSSNYLLEELANYLRISGLLVKTIDSHSNFYLEDKHLSTILTELADSSNLCYDIILVDCNVNLPMLYKMLSDKKFPKEVYYRCLNYCINELSKQLDQVICLTYDDNIDLNNNKFKYINEQLAINLYNRISYEYRTYSKDYTTISSFNITNNSNLYDILNDISSEIVKNMKQKYLSDIKIKLKK